MLPKRIGTRDSYASLIFVFAAAPGIHMPAGNIVVEEGASWVPRH
jgi:hypothetical protein